jgi:hypothetical protein
MANDTEKTKRFEEEARPNAGTNVPSHKLNPAGEGQHEAYRFRTDTPVRDAEEDAGKAKDCLDAQLGRGDHSASRTGGRLGDSTCQRSAGAPASDECGCE